MSKTLLFSASALFLVSAIWNSIEYWPSKPQIYTEPSPAAKIIYTLAPSIYDPPEEVFFERYSGLGEVPIIRPSIILGPHCRKAMFLGPGTEAHLYSRSLCNMSESSASQVLSLFASRFSSEPHASFLVSPQAIDEMMVIAARGEIYLPSSNPSFKQFLDETWATPEKWGAWSTSSTAYIRFKAPDVLGPLIVDIDYTAFLAGSHEALTIIPSINGHDRSPIVAKPNNIPSNMVITISVNELKERDGVIEISFNLDHPMSPSQLGISPDGRLLGIGLTKLTFR